MKLNKTNLSILGYIILLIIFLILIFNVGNRVSNITSSLDDIQSEQVETINAIRLESMKDIQVRTGQEIYVPAYSTLKTDDSSKGVDFSITLSIRNTDPTNEIEVRSVDYYDSNGERFKRFLTDPMSVKPMGTKDFSVARSDKFGGSGGNFYVVWVADTLVTEPIVEAIMLGPAPHGYSLISPGRVAKSK